MKQMDLPGIDPPPEGMPTDEETATTVLIFADEDKVQERVVEALRHLFFVARPGSGSDVNMVRNNCKAFLRRLFAASASALPGALDQQIRAIVREELQAHMKEVRKEVDRLKGVKKRPSK